MRLTNSSICFSATIPETSCFSAPPLRPSSNPGRTPVAHAEGKMPSGQPTGDRRYNYQLPLAPPPPELPPPNPPNPPPPPPKPKPPLLHPPPPQYTVLPVCSTRRSLYPQRGHRGLDPHTPAPTMVRKKRTSPMNHALGELRLGGGTVCVLATGGAPIRRASSSTAAVNPPA